MMEWMLLGATVVGTTFTGMLWYYEYQNRKSVRRNNPPSHLGKTDRHVG